MHFLSGTGTRPQDLSLPAGLRRNLRPARIRYRI